jgi:hypothetical protein
MCAVEMIVLYYSEYVRLSQDESSGRRAFFAKVFGKSNFPKTPAKKAEDSRIEIS